MPYFAHMLASKMYIQTGLVALHAHVNAPVSPDAGSLRKSLCVHDIEKNIALQTKWISLGFFLR